MASSQAKVSSLVNRDPWKDKMMSRLSTLVGNKYMYTISLMKRNLCVLLMLIVSLFLFVSSVGPGAASVSFPDHIIEF